MKTILLVSIAFCAHCAGQGRPNILLLFADDLGRYASAYADPFDKIKGLPLTLRDGGYHIGLTYKPHLRESIIGGKQNSTLADGRSSRSHGSFRTIL